MQTIEIKGEIRTNVGKGPARQLRFRKFIPGVIYSGGTSTPLVLSPQEIKKVLHSSAGRNAVIQLKLEEGDRMAILRDHDTDPLTGAIVHADLFEISMDRTLDLRVPIELSSTPVGVKEEGGMVQTSLRELHIRCLPAHIPDRIQVDISALRLHQTLHVRDLQLPAEIERRDHLEQAIVSIVPAISEAKLAALLSATPKDGAVAEPELVGDKTAEGKEEAKAEPKGKAEPKKEEKTKK